MEPSETPQTQGQCESVYLRPALAGRAIEFATPTILSIVNEMGERPFVHIVVLDAAGNPVFDGSIGAAPEGPEFESTIAAIARSKAGIHFRTGRPSRVIRDRAPHAVMVGDTTHGGSAEHEGLIVAVSGVQAEFDEAIAGMVASLCWGLCKSAQLRYLADPSDEHFYREPYAAS